MRNDEFDIDSDVDSDIQDENDGIRGKLETLFQVLYRLNETDAALLADCIINVMGTHDIHEGHELWNFLAEAAHESGGFKVTSENLNYSAEALFSKFRKYFPTQELAEQYARNPQAIANRIYANRMGNGDETSGDGWAHRGAGIFQNTGKDQQYAIADEFGIPRDEIFERLVSDYRVSVRAAARYWTTTACQRLSRKSDRWGVAATINCGNTKCKTVHGWDKRQKEFVKIKRFFEVNAPVKKVSQSGTAVAAGAGAVVVSANIVSEVVTAVDQVASATKVIKETATNAAEVTVEVNSVVTNAINAVVPDSMVNVVSVLSTTDLPIMLFMLGILGVILYRKRKAYNNGALE